MRTVIYHVLNVVLKTRLTRPERVIIIIIGVQARVRFTFFSCTVDFKIILRRANSVEKKI